MNRKIIYILILLLISCNDLVGPESHGGSSGDSHPEPIGNNEIIDATSYTEWKYYQITPDSLILIPNIGQNFNEIAFWDIAFQRNHIKTNSGTSGVGNAGAYVDSIETWNGTLFNDLIQIEEELSYTYDMILNTFYLGTGEFTTGSTNPSLETWAQIDINNNYTMTITNNKFIIRTSDGNNYYKFWMRDYYDENGISGNITLIYDYVVK